MVKTQLGQRQKSMWGKSTKRPWPNMSLGLISGSAAISSEKDHNKDSERLQILISVTIWVIWTGNLEIIKQ